MLKIMDYHIKQLPQTFITGIDDATKCPVIGSIYLAGVTATPETIAHWHELGVKDSKLIAPKKREELAAIIKQTATAYALEPMPPHMIDNKVLNLNAWEMITLCNIVQKLAKKTDLGTIYVDNWEVSEKLFFSRLSAVLSPELKDMLSKHGIKLQRTKILKASFVAQHRADENYVVVGAASILAKSASDEEYRKLKKTFGDFGSGSPADPKTRLFVWQHRKNPPPLIRTSWNTFKTLSQIESIEEDWFVASKKKKISSSNIHNV